mgnify:CR=1 FL=1
MFKVVVKGITKEFERSYRDYVYGTMAAAASASFRLRPGVRPLAIVVIALAAVYVPRTARIVRASVLVVREMEFVQAALACGARHSRIVWKHVLPNCMAPLIVQLTFIFAYSVLAEAVLRKLRRPGLSTACQSIFMSILGFPVIESGSGLPTGSAGSSPSQAAAHPSLARRCAHRDS